MAGEARGELALTSGNVHVERELGTNVISISLPERALRLRATTEEEADRWATRFLAVVAPVPRPTSPSVPRSELSRRLAQIWEACSRWLLEGRAALLYHYIPFDKTLWGRLESPPSLVLMVIASWPELSTPWVRPAFFTLLLVCVLPDLDAFQLSSFIIQLKGSQFLSSLFVLFYGFAMLCEGR